jgi:hypothetical protein
MRSEGNGITAEIDFIVTMAATSSPCPPEAMPWPGRFISAGQDHAVVPVRVAELRRQALVEHQVIRAASRFPCGWNFNVTGAYTYREAPNNRLSPRRTSSRSASALYF